MNESDEVAINNPETQRLIDKQIQDLFKVQAEINKALDNFRRINGLRVDNKSLEIITSATQASQGILTPSKTKKVVDVVAVIQQAIRDLESVIDTTSTEEQTTGYIFKETKTVPVSYPIHGALKSVISSLNKKIAAIEAGVVQETQAVNELKAEMRSLKNEVGYQLNQAQQQGRVEGRSEIVGLLAAAAEEAPELRDYLSKLRVGGELLALMPAATAAHRPVVSKVKDDNAEKAKLEQFAGKAKSPVIAELVELAETSKSDKEKLMINFLIFQLMLHKNDKTITAIITDAEALFTEMKLPHTAFLMKQLASSKTDDALSHAPLTPDELTAFCQLVGAGKNSAIYLPNDGFAYRAFKTLWAASQGKKVRDPLTEQEYLKEFKSLMELPALEADVQTPAKGTTPFWSGSASAASSSAAPPAAGRNNGYSKGYGDVE